MRKIMQAKQFTQTFQEQSQLFDQTKSINQRVGNLLKTGVQPKDSFMEKKGSSLLEQQQQPIMHRNVKSSSTASIKFEDTIDLCDILTIQSPDNRSEF